MNLEDITQHFRAQSNLATPTTKEQIDIMVAARKEAGSSEEILAHVASKVGVKQLFFMTRIPGKIEIFKVWDDELNTLIDILANFTYFATSNNNMPEYIKGE